MFADVIRASWMQRHFTECTSNDTLAPHPLPQPKLKVAKYNQTYCRKVKSNSAMDFQYFCLVSIFASFLYSRTKMLKFTNIALKARCLFAFPSPCMDFMEYFYTGYESHMYYPSFDTLLLTF